jgi:transposase
VYRVKDWAEVHRLFRREGWSKTAIAVKLGMSRNTVDRLLELDEPPRYLRPGKGSSLDPFADAIAAMLDDNPKVSATVILERLRPMGYGGGITILKDRLQQIRPLLLAAKSYQRTSYLPGEIAQLDWWHTGVHVRWARAPPGRPSGWWRHCRTRPPMPPPSPSVGPRLSSAPRHWAALSDSGGCRKRR